MNHWINHAKRIEESKSYQELEKSYGAGELHPLDLKKAVGNYVDKLVEPVRKHFENDKKARDLLEQVQSFQVTR